jgi:hypothetical protein
MAPIARLGFRLAGLKLVMGIEGAVVLLRMAMKAEHQRLRHLAASQDVAVRRRRLLFGLAAPSHIMTTETG